MFNWFFLVALILHILLTSPTPVNSTEALTALKEGTNSLANEFLHQLLTNNPDVNAVASPISILIPLAQLALFSKGLVLQQLLQVLNLRSKDEIKSDFLSLTKELNSVQDVVLKIANKCYANEHYKLSNSFKDDSKKYFGTEAENIDFSQKNHAAEMINKWVEEGTNGKIKNLVDPSMFSQDTRLVLVNVIYFLGNWLYKFDEKNTATKDFHKSNGETVPLKIMYQQNNFNYGENDDLQALEMPYNNSALSFLVLLPKNKTLIEIVETLRGHDGLSNIIGSMKQEEVRVSIPKMLINTRIDVGDILKKVNASAMFDHSNDDFEGILDKNQKLYVSTAVQKAFISIDESGTEAAAATANIVYTMTATMPNVYVFDATRPYAFYILHNKVPYFCGVFMGSQ